MVDNPPYPDDAPTLKKLKAIGVEPGQDFDPDNLDPKDRDALDRAAQAVFGLLEMAPYDMDTVNGWLLPLNLGRYGTDYNTRAFVAFLGLGALTAEDCVYPSAFVDGDGRPLDGEKEYMIHFKKDGAFPSTAESGRSRRTGRTSMSATRSSDTRSPPRCHLGTTPTAPWTCTSRHGRPGRTKTPTGCPAPERSVQPDRPHLPAEGTN